MGERPSFQFYPNDYLGSERVALMTLEEEGCYIRLLCYCWNYGSIPSSPELLARLIGKGASTTLATKLIPMFEKDPNDPSKLIHLRLQKERKKQDEWRRKSSIGGKKSAKNKKLNRSRVLQPPLQGCNQPNGNTSSSSSSSSSKKNIYVEFFENKFWPIYPARNGNKIGKEECLIFIKNNIPENELSLLEEATQNYASSPDVKKGIGIKDPIRFLKQKKIKGEKISAPWKEWVNINTVNNEIEDFNVGSGKKLVNLNNYLKAQNELFGE